MRSRLQDIIHGSFWAFVQLVFLQAGALIVTMFLTRALSASDYGVIPLINSLVLLFIVFVGLGIPASLARYLSYVDDAYAQKRLIIKVLTAFAVWSIIICVIVFQMIPLIADLLDEAQLNELQWLFIPVLMLELFRAFIEKICHGTGNMKISASFSGWTSFSIIVLTIPLVLNHPSAEMAFIAKIIAFIVPVLRAILSINKALSKNNNANIELPANSKVAKYGLPLALISLSGFGFVQLDMIFLAYYEDTSSVGMYSVGVLLLLKLTAISKAIGFGVSPFYAKKNKNQTELSKYFLHGLKYSLLVAIPAVSLLLVNAEYTMSLLFGGYYEKAGDTVRVLCLYLLMTSIMAVASPILDFGGKAKIRAYAAFTGAALNVILNILLIPEYGLLGAAFATIIGYAVFFVVTIKSVHDMAFFNGEGRKQVLNLIFIVLPLLLALMMVIKMYFNQTSFWINLIIIVTLYPMLLFVTKVISKNELHSLKSGITR